jgi:hypothetical protein
VTKTKYNSNKTIVDGITFDSKDESIYYQYLKFKKSNGDIKDFETQPKYTVIDKFEKLGVKTMAITYSPDFKVYHNDGSVELIDVKSIGATTQQGELRRKLFDHRYAEKLTWVCRNLKHGDADGWIEYGELKKKLAKQRKEKQVALKESDKV